MALVISRGMTLGPSPAALAANLPLIGWRTLVTAQNVAADHEADGYPALNLGNPSTALDWRSDDDGEQYVTIAVLDVATIDYIGIARHNLGSAGIAISVEAHNEPDAEDPTWIEIAEPYMPANDGPLVRWFAAASYAGIRLKLAAGSAPPRIAVLYAGLLTVMPSGLPFGFIPTPHARMDTVTDGLTQGGNYLGQIVTLSHLSGEASFAHVDYDWYRENFAGFAAQARRRPFFFAWLPDEYPDEVGFAWVTSDIRPDVARHFSGVVANFGFSYSAIA